MSSLESVRPGTRDESIPGEAGRCPGCGIVGMLYHFALPLMTQAGGLGGSYHQTGSLSLTQTGQVCASCGNNCLSLGIGVTLEGRIIRNGKLATGGSDPRNKEVRI